MRISELLLKSSTKRSVLATVTLLLALTANAQSFRENNIQIGLFYPITTNGVSAATATNTISVNLVAGVSTEETAFTFAGITNVVRRNATGLQFAGFSNHIGGRSKGILFGGLLNTYGQGEGLQFGGISNLARNEVSGMQFAGFANRAAAVNGFQLAGFSNVAADLKGAQFAGFANTSQDMDGSQFAGFINKADDVKGSQFAGFINIARKVVGTQVAGFINIADSSDNPIGIINIIKHGEKSIGVNTDDNGTSLLSFRSGGRNLYGIIGAGYNFWSPELDLYALEAGLGAHLPVINGVRVNTEVSALGLNNFSGLSYLKSSLRVLPGITVGKTVEIFGGPALSYVHTNSGQTLGRRTNFLSRWNDRHHNLQGLYVGYSLGLQVLF